ncbi:YadA-like family protein, partial [Labrys portucalensis]
SQLFSLGNSVASGLGGGSSFDPSSGTVITSLNYGGSTFTSVQSVLDKIGGSINGGGIKYFHANSTDADSVASGKNAVGIGPNSVASGDYSFAAGNGAQATGTSSVATGNGAAASGNDSIATGTQAKASGEASIATGKNAEASGNGSTAMGSGSKATADGATAVGANASATTANSTAIGNGAQASANEGDVALGAGSVTSTVVQTTSATIGTKSYGGFAGTAPGSTVSVGSAGNERTVTNVAAGQITATSTDAINGSQLYSVANGLQTQIATVSGDVTQLGNNANTLGTTTATTMGGGAKYDPTTGITGFQQNVKAVDAQGNAAANATAYSNVGAALTQLDTNTTNLANAAVKYDDPSNKTKITLGGTGATTAVTIDNLANGEVSKASKQAINGSQLYNSASSVAAALGGNSVVNADGSISNPSYTVGGNSYNNVGSAITALDKRFDGIGGSIANLQSQVSNNLKEARQGISQAMAASALRYDDRPGKVSAAAGMAVYHRQVGLAAGLGWTSEDAKWRANIAGTYSAGGRKPDFGVMGGLSYTFN